MSDKDSLIGKMARVTECGYPYFTVGHVCVITRFDGVDYWADFNGQENSWVNGMGVWCIGRSWPEQFELIEMEES